jgi:septal ring factor EnvC (AmiA/AmiB activator)
MAYLVRQYGNYQPYGHAGEDIACPVGTPVQAMADGTVLWADWGTNLPGDESEWGYRQRWYLYKGFPGIVTVIQHPGWIGIYAHLSSNDSAPRGAKVKAGQLIGYSGDTGGVAPHLHREALVDLNYTTGGGLIYGRTDPTKYDGIAAAAIVPQSTTPKTGGLTVADINTLTKQLNDIKAALAPINTASGEVSLRQFIADGTRAAQAAEKNTGPINVSGGRQEGIRDFIAKGTRAAERSEARLAALEAALNKALDTPGADLATLTDAAAAGAEKALSNLRVVNGDQGR